MLCWFLLCRKVNQLYVGIGPLFSGFPSHLDHQGTLSSLSYPDEPICRAEVESEMQPTRVQIPRGKRKVARIDYTVYFKSLLCTIFMLKVLEIYLGFGGWVGIKCSSAQILCFRSKILLPVQKQDFSAFLTIPVTSCNTFKELPFNSML